jgi:hypothetical protein
MLRVFKSLRRRAGVRRRLMSRLSVYDGVAALCCEGEVCGSILY